MFGRSKTIFVILILFLSILITGCNFGLVATDPSENTSRGSTPRSNGFDWNPVEVLSEPVMGQDFNTGDSNWVKIAAEGNKIYIVWNDNNDTNGAGTDADIFYRYFDGGIWSKVQVISEPVPGQDFSTGSTPSIAVENGKIYVAWGSTNDTNGAGTDSDVFFRCNLTGTGWEPIQVISEPVPGQNFNTGQSGMPDIAVENGKIYLAWEDRNDTNGAGGIDADIFYSCNLTGSSWEPVQVISEPVVGYDFDSLSSYRPDIGVENGKIYVVWDSYNETNGAGTDTDVFYRCNLTGSNWEPMQVISEPVEGLNQNMGGSWIPKIVVENSKSYVVWYDNSPFFTSGSDYDIFYRCNLTGSGWEDIQVISEPVPGQNFNIGGSTAPSIDVDNGKVYIIWSDDNDTNGAATDEDILFKANVTGSSWEPVYVISEPVEGQNFNNWSTATVYRSEIVAEADNVYAAWQDENNTYGAGNDDDIFYRAIPSSLTLLNPKLTPTSGNTSTYFNFTVKYKHIENSAPTQIKVNISGTEHSMLEVDPLDINYIDGKDYYFNIMHLAIGAHTYKFWATNGTKNTFTSIFNNPTVYNTPPNITTLDNLTAIEDTYYEVQYEHDDIDVANVGQSIIWNYSSNASWLDFDNITTLLNGSPMNDDVGSYWVNISINDTMAIDFTNFTLTVVEVNDDPMLNTTDIETTYEDELYEVDYNATDIDSPLIDQAWSLATNATSWLDIDTVTGIISGTPTNDEVGDYWVNVSVDDGEIGSAFTNFTLIVLNVNDPPLIETTDLLTVFSDTLYEVDYNASDIDPTNDILTWSLDTNATWLSIGSDTGILSGTPTEADAGWYNVNVSVDDGNDGQDWHEFILSVIPKGLENEPPIITTTDKISTTAGETYINVYEATDDRTPVGSLIWLLNTNASWLSFNKVTVVLSGNPLLSHVGWYWVNISVYDGEGGSDSHNFTLTVYETANQPPNILTEDDVNAVVGELYLVDYEAEDDRTSVDYLQWSLKTNATWLTMHMTTGVLSGTPDSSDIGSYIVNVSVFDGEDGWDFHNFMLTVTTEPIDENNAPELSDTTLTPSEGDVETEFTFTVHYYDEDADVPSLIKVFIDNGSYDMTLKEGEDPANGIYTFSIKLSEGNHTFYFTASDGKDPVTTGAHSTPYINKLVEVDGDKTEKDSDTDWWIWVLIIVIVIIVVLVLLFLFVLKKKPDEEPTEEERLAEEPPPVPGVESEPAIVEEPAPEAPTPEQPPTQHVPPEPEPAPETPPPEQVPTPETPPPEQPPTPEVPPEQVPAPETPPVEQPPQETPPPEVTPPQVAPQVETVPQPAPQPQVQPQAAPQEPAGEPQVQQQKLPAPKIEDVQE